MDGVYSLHFCCLLMYACGGVGLTEGVKVFGLQEDIWASPNTNDMVSYNLSLRFPKGGEQSEAGVLTVCYWARPFTLSSYESHISLATSDYENDVLHLYRRGGHHGFYYNGVRQFGFGEFISPIGLQEWAHYCHVFNSGMYLGYVGGKLLAEGPISTSIVPLPLHGYLTFGQEQDSLAGGYEVTQIFRGQLSLINIYNRRLSDVEVMKQAMCQGTSMGEIFSTEREEVQVIGASVYNIDEAELCSQPAEYVILPEPRYFPESRHACGRIGYEVFSPSTSSENIQLHNESLQFAVKCQSNYHLWIGATDEAEEDVWRKFSNNEVVVNPPFEQKEPNGGDGEDCLLMFLLNGKWVDTSCNIQWPACVPCQITRSTPLRLRGLCFETEEETYYEALGYREEKPYFHGYFGNMIYRNEDGVWIMFDTTASETIATLALPYESSYPIGRHTWTLQKPTCNNPTKAQMELSITVCTNQQYSCSNGDCIDKHKRCDGTNDCSDFSDEDNCKMLVIPRGYRSTQPPVNTSSTTTSTSTSTSSSSSSTSTSTTSSSGQQQKHPILLESTVSLQHIVEISDVNRVLNVEVKLEFKWKDARLTYLNLGDTLEWNRLHRRTHIEDIWTPDLSFPNVYNGDINTVTDEVAIRKLGTPLPMKFNDVRMDTAYGGNSATLVRLQQFSGKFACSFDVFYYPFDLQRCSLLLQLASARKDQAAFSQDLARVVNVEQRLLPLFEVTQCVVTVVDAGNNETRFSVLEVELELRRRWTVIVVTLYLPTTMLLFVGYSSLFVTLPRIDVRLAVSLTTMLVLYTLFSNTSDALPVTAYVKMIDVWFFACIMFLFSVTMVHVLTEYLQTREERRKVMMNVVIKVGQKPTKKMPDYHRGDLPLRVMLWSRTLVLPLAALIFNVVYWAMLTERPDALSPRD